eukprot:c18389_g1_i1.p1 GENE.c18389_g1_i1~~c18389_g1_i1.p1  ORF type:complete len:934 (-),score=132.01 c18389_g1_i1:23-2824(-)
MGCASRERFYVCSFHSLISENRLSGSLPSEIGLLTNLRHWTMVTNELSGSIPSQIGQLQQLLDWYIDDNELSGTIPTEVGQLQILQDWLISSNQLTGSIPTEIGKVTRLRDWWIYDNQLSGPIPSEIGALQKLRDWWINANFLSSSIPSEIGMLTDLERWVTDGVPLSGSIPSEIGKLQSLREWASDKNQLSGSVPTQVGLLTNLSLWLLSFNQLSGTIPSQVGYLTKLAHWGMYNNQLRGRIPSEIGKLTNLLLWQMSNNRLSGSILTQVGNLVHLVNWDMSRNQLSGSIPTQVGKLTDLQSCFLTNNTLRGSIPPEFASLTALRYLVLASNKLSGSLPHLPPTLEDITLHHNRLSGSIPSEISQLSRLRILSLFDNKLSGSVPPLTLPSALLLLFNNLLSCRLPSKANRSIHQTNSSTITLVALGNKLAANGVGSRVDARSWLFSWDSQSTHLFDIYPRLWVRMLALFGCCVLMASVLRYLGRSMLTQKLERGVELVAVGARSQRQYSLVLMGLWRRCLHVCLGMTGFAGIYILALSLSRRVYECSDLTLRAALADSRFSLAEGSFLAVIVCVVVHVVCSVCGVLWVMRWSRQSALRMVCGWDGNCNPVLMLVWVLIISVLHFPVLVYLVTESFPSNNVLNMNSAIMTIFRGLVSPWLVFSGEWLIPKLSVWVADRHHSGVFGRRFEAQSSESRLSLLQEYRAKAVVKISTDLILVSQLVNMVVAPVASQLILHNRCLALVTQRFWQPCQEPNDLFHVDVEITIPAPDVTFVITSPALRQDQVCSTQFDNELCVRGVMTSIATLSVSKVVIQTLFVLLRALVLAINNRMRKSNAATRRQRLIRVLAPSEVAVTRSIMSLLMLGVTLGGIAPLIWPLVLFCVHSTIVLWRFSGQNSVTVSNERLVSVRVVWLGIGIQVGFMIWFISANVSEL